MGRWVHDAKGEFVGVEVGHLPVVAFDSRIDRSQFCCGKPELDEWLRTQAGQQERRGNARTFFALDPERRAVVGYYATTTYRLDLDETSRAYGVGKRRYPVPAVLLARLAVDEAWAGQGVGRHLLVHALAGFAAASRLVGFEVVVVHAIDAQAVTFYARYGFVRFAEHPLHLFMGTESLRRTFESVRRRP